ncbi:ATP-binding protein [Streptomyces niveiscabiei]|uniref:ATP-binding protein n=1 Tax=Streptomyces niveiscabiei TaxID=164115 RepID=UPI0029AE2F87|nr:ATP-binding protein [Streptomyces niveiscabiei]MDX3387711.1 ATP-binding protein [Streptomyces niveiscabiei]
MLISHGDDDRPALVLTDTPDGPASRMAARLGLTPVAPVRLPPSTTLTLPGTDLTSARKARHHIRTTAETHHLPPPHAYDLEIVTGELVANALEHTKSTTITLTCTFTPTTAVLTVTDEGTAHPFLPHPALTPDEEHGRGLLITDAIATRWGTCRTRRGLMVWAEVELQAEHPKSTP